MPHILPTVVAGAISWFVWLALRNFVVRSPLDKIPGPKSASWIKGNLTQILERHAWPFLDDLGIGYGKVVRLTDLFGRPALYVFDPKALHQIVVKETDIYELPEWFTEAIKLTTGPGLLGVHGADHRRQRRMLTPVFSIKHMRSMTPLFYDVAHRLREGLANEVGDTAKTVDILSWFNRTALELIGQGGLGYSLDELNEPTPNKYGEALKKMIPFLAQNGPILSFAEYLKYLGPANFRAAMIDWLPFPALKRLRDVVDKVDVDTNIIYEEKKACLDAGEEGFMKQVGEGKDIMSILLRANQAASDADRMSEEEVIGQMALLVVAATDTTSTALTQVLQILSERPDIQDKLRAELLQAQDEYGEDIPYDALVSLPYLDAICRESLRLYPPSPYVFRQTRKDIVMPLSNPIQCTDGTTMSEVPVPAGTTVVIAIQPANVIKELWGDDALEFKPERWLSPAPKALTDARIPGVYSNLMTFNGGGRACIGFKFSQLEMKVVLSILLSSFKVSFAEESKDVVWNAATVRYPTVGKDSLKSSYPLTIEGINNRSPVTSVASVGSKLE